MNRKVTMIMSVICFATAAFAAETKINLLSTYKTNTPEKDWLIDASPYKAGVYRSDDNKNIILSNGLIQRVFKLGPNCGTIGFDNLMTGDSILRALSPEAEVVLDGTTYKVGGFSQPASANRAYITPQRIAALTNDEDAMQFAGFSTGPIEKRFDYKPMGLNVDYNWPPKGVHLRLNYKLPESDKACSGVTVSVHYNLYDGLPLISKWFTLKNNSAKPVHLNTFTSEILAYVERGSQVERSTLAGIETRPNMHIESDYQFGGMNAESANAVVHHEFDRAYTSQVSYLLKTRCVLKTYLPKNGPDVNIAAGDTFESFRVYEMPYDSYDRERQGLYRRKMYRTISPWTQENPLMHHVRRADWKSVKNAVDQAVEVGFEMIIMTFGSGFNIENDSDAYLKEMKKYADYAHSKGIRIGGYSLLASRRVGGGNDVISLAGERPRFNNAPCILSDWGKDYFRKITEFYEKTGMNLLEHDGSYPGDACNAENHDHKSYASSQWLQWKVISDYYKWCRSEGIFLNVPDVYFLSGSNKTGMGYREVNWSLPRAEQVMHTRQNIYDGTWTKTPSMGWMFVPLSQYHGGGAAATIEPLDEHFDHYERMMVSNLAMGVQACYRGPRLYDTDRVRDMIIKNVDWYKKHRAILESDIVHGRRCDARDIDWVLHANPNLKEKGMLIVFNPLKEKVKRTIKVNLYYTGLTKTAKIRQQQGRAKKYNLSREYEVEIPVEIDSEGFSWFVIE